MFFLLFLNCFIKYKLDFHIFFFLLENTKLFFLRIYYFIYIFVKIYFFICLFFVVFMKLNNYLNLCLD